MKKTIKVYAPNLAQRKDRRISLLQQFKNKEEFELCIVQAIEKTNGAWGLWQTFYSIVEKETKEENPYFIFCEDDHMFTSDY